MDIRPRGLPAGPLPKGRKHTKGRERGRNAKRRKGSVWCVPPRGDWDQTRRFGRSAEGEGGSSSVIKKGERVVNGQGGVEEGSWGAIDLELDQSQTKP